MKPVPRVLRTRLLAWYRRHRRDLPWRRTRDPWAIWVSEVMLQQTQVATATPYYQSFMSRFPDVASFARAGEAEVLAAWAGLGYYRRARHLHEASRIVVREHAGRVPGDLDAFARLPGVGRYTAGAVLSMGFDKSLAVLDGNVARVLSRLHALDAAVRDPAGARRLWSLADALVPMRGAGDWNQALMELGAMICTPVNPRCDVCPVRSMCVARATDAVHRFPPVPARRPPRVVHRAVALIERDGRVLLVRREGRLLGGLWEPPAADFDGARVPGNAAQRRRLAERLGELGIPGRLAPTPIRLRHVLSHRDVRGVVWRVAPPRVPRTSSTRRFVDPARPDVPVTGLVKALARALSASAPPRKRLKRHR